VNKSQYGGGTIVLMYENGTMTPVETVLRRGWGDKRERWRG
jgi:hypothetical protein